MKRVISYLKKELGNCEQHEMISLGEGNHRDRKFWSEEGDVFKVAISILEKAENNTGS